MNHLKFFLKAVFAFFFLLAGLLQATGQPQAGDTTQRNRPDTARRAATPVTAARPQPKVLRVFKVMDGYPKDTTKAGKAGIGDIIVIQVSDLEGLLNQSKCKTVEGKDSSANCNPDQNKIGLFINGRLIKSISPISGAPQVTGRYGELQYRLERNADNDEAWTDLLGAPKISGGKFFIHPVTISVGLENGYPIYASPRNFNLVRIKSGWFWVCFIALGLYIFFIIRLARHRGLLRDRMINLSVLGMNTSNSKLPYSLARFQMAFWFTLIIASFMFIWLITGSYDIISTSILALIGISVGTSLSAAVIDNSKAEDVLQKTVDLKTEQDQLNKDIPGLQQLINANPQHADVVKWTAELSTKMGRLPQIQPEIDKNLAILKPKKSEGFFNDILSDANGISFHRLQMFVWTMILGLIFIFSVWVRLSMPEFSTTLLALQGLTAGTYLGFKIPEKQT